MIRISLDVTEGTFNGISKICEEERRSKEGYLRLMIDGDFREREKAEVQKR